MTDVAGVEGSAPDATVEVTENPEPATGAPDVAYLQREVDAATEALEKVQAKKAKFDALAASIDESVALCQATLDAAQAALAAAGSGA